MVCFLLVIYVLFYPIVCLTTSQEKLSSIAPRLEPGSRSKKGWEIEKLRQEVLKIQKENENLRSPWTTLSSHAAFITALVAVVGVLLTLWKQHVEHNRQQELDREQRKRDREQRERENQREVDQKFTSILMNLCAENEALQASAAVSMLTFLKPEYAALHDQVFNILLANLKISHSPAVHQLVVEDFEQALPGKLSVAKSKGEEFTLDLSRTKLDRINLSALDLRSADLGFTQLPLANLTGANLFRARGYGANLEKTRLSRANLHEARLQTANLQGAHLHQCRLVAADLKKTDLRGAQFYQAEMQSAHLEGANIQGASFEQANLHDTYLTGLFSFPGEKTLESIVKAKNWSKAHFDTEIQVKLAEIAKTIRWENQ